MNSENDGILMRCAAAQRHTYIKFVNTIISQIVIQAIQDDRESALYGFRSHI